MSNFCKICLKEFEYHGIFKKTCICNSCFKQFKIIDQKEKIDGVITHFIYEYNSFFKTQLFHYKGCYDYELRSIFLDRFKYEIKIKYSSYIIIPLPSTKKDDEKRGFNHVEEIFSSLNIKIIKAIYKNKDFKQSDRSKQERSKVKYDFSIKENIDLKNKKILIVDDILTTGSSLRSAINLVKSKNPKTINALIIARKLD